MAGLPSAGLPRYDDVTWPARHLSTYFFLLLYSVLYNIPPLRIASCVPYTFLPCPSHASPKHLMVSHKTVNPNAHTQWPPPLCPNVHGVYVAGDGLSMQVKQYPDTPAQRRTALKRYEPTIEPQRGLQWSECATSSFPHSY